MKDDNPLVAIKCLTYNQEPYIRQCLEGFIMQKTNFRFVAIVHDDASTDATAIIIKDFAEKYPNVIIPICETENLYSKKNGSITRIMNKAIEETGCKYIAVCEGDDYWTDPLKLQKQVDFMESHPDYGMIHTDFNIVNHASIQEFRFHKNFSRVKNIEDGLLLGTYGIGTLTSLYRKSIYDKLPRHNIEKGFLMGDLPIWIEISHISKIKYIKDVTASYRLLKNSASHSENLEKRITFIRNAYDCRKYYATLYSKFNLLKKIEKNCEIDVFKVNVKEGKNKKNTFQDYIKMVKKYNLIHLPFTLYMYVLFYVTKGLLRKS